MGCGKSTQGKKVAKVLQRTNTNELIMFSDDEGDNEHMGIDLKLLNINSDKSGKNIFTIAAILIIIFALTSCSKKIYFQPSAYVPAAEGAVKVRKDNNNNYRIKIFVRNLAASKRLESPRDNYVVWSETESNGIKNIGQIISSKKLFSKKFSASLTAVSPFKPTRVFITGEDNGNVQYPGFQTVLTTRSF